MIGPEVTGVGTSASMRIGRRRRITTVPFSAQIVTVDSRDADQTKPTKVSAERHIAAIANEEQRQDARTLVALMRRVTRQQPRMWGPSIVGFGSYHYRYASGHEGDSALAAFAVRGNGLVVYTEASFEGRDVLLAGLGKHRTGKVCVYIRRLANVDLKVLETLVARSIAETKRRYPQAN
jgi:hypothetical protein